MGATAVALQLTGIIANAEEFTTARFTWWSRRPEGQSMSVVGIVGARRLNFPLAATRHG
jgi:hypothetical protein